MQKDIRLEPWTGTEKDNGYFIFSMNIVPDTVNNSSIIYYTLTPYSVTGYTNYTFDVEETYNGNHEKVVNARNVNPVSACSGTFVLKHDINGNRIIDLYINVRMHGTKNFAYSAHHDVVTLPTISQSAKIKSVQNVNLGANCDIIWDTTDTSFTYKLTFSLLNWTATTGSISTGGLSEYRYTGYQIPIEVAHQLPKSNTGTMTVVLTTYNGVTQIGLSDSRTFTVTVPDSCKPTITKDTFKVYLDNSGKSAISNWGVYVSGYSKARLEANATANYSASISKYKITGGYGGVNGINVDARNGALNYTGGTLSGSAEGTSTEVTFTIKAVDTRNMESEPALLKVTVYNSTDPKIASFTARRTDIKKEASVMADWSYSSIAGHNSATAELEYKESTSNSWVRCNDSIIDGQNVILSQKVFEENRAYNIRLTVTDLLGKKVVKEIILQTPFVLMDFKSGGKGLGIGGIATKDRLEINLDTAFINCNVYIQDGMGNETTLEDYIKQVVRSMQT